MEEGLFRAELEAVAKRYGYLLWRRCQSSEALFRRVLLRIAESGAELRGREDKLSWLYAIVDEVVGERRPNSALELETWHAGDPSPFSRSGAERDSETQRLLAELDLARERFGAEVDLMAAIEASFPDEALPMGRARPAAGLAALGLVVIALVVGIAWPRDEAPVFVPDHLELALLIERDGIEERRTEPQVLLRGGDRVRVELLVPSKQIMSVLVHEKDGSLTPLATGRLFHPGRHQLPQTLFVDERTPLVARLVAGPPALVRTATSTGQSEGVLAISIRPEAANEAR